MQVSSSKNDSCVELAAPRAKPMGIRFTGRPLSKHGDVIVSATTACLLARLRTAPIRSRERQRADAQLLMTFCLADGSPETSSPLGLGSGRRACFLWIFRSEERRVRKKARFKW